MRTFHEILRLRHFFAVHETRGADFHSPFSLSQAEYRVDEGDIRLDLGVTVTRGVESLGGQQLGPIDSDVVVRYAFRSVSATQGAGPGPGIDFVASNGAINFTAGDSYAQQRRKQNGGASLTLTCAERILAHARKV